MTNAGVKEQFARLIDIIDTKKGRNPAYIIYKLQQIKDTIEDTYSCGTEAEIQDAIDEIGTGSGTIFVESGTIELSATGLTFDSGGSIIIYGHGDNTILEATDKGTVINITDQTSVTIANLKIDVSNNTPTSAGFTYGIIVNEGNDRPVYIENVTFVGEFDITAPVVETDKLSLGIDAKSNFLSVTECRFEGTGCGVYDEASSTSVIHDYFTECGLAIANITGAIHSKYTDNEMTYCYVNIYSSAADYATFSDNIISDVLAYGIQISGDGCKVQGNIISDCVSDAAIKNAGDYVTIVGNVCTDNTKNGITNTGNGVTINGNTCISNGENGISTSGDDVVVSNNVTLGNTTSDITATGNRAIVTSNGSGATGVILNTSTGGVTANNIP